MCPHCANAPHRQSNAPQAGAQLPTSSLADTISIPFLSALALVQTFPSSRSDLVRSSP